jgi:predicted SprT family Zn-dependent metalloprotease
MDLFQAERQAKLLMAAHGLTGWRFEWDNAKSRFGRCRHSDRLISLSRVLTVQRTEEAVRNTVLHEIAHALVGASHGHDAVWRRKALSIGCDGKRCSADKVEVSYKWHGLCPNGHIIKRHRKPSGNRACGKCSRSFDPRFLIRWVAAY